ncbi:MAG TPA: DUF2235 domain-containing protein [Hyalangium sp.]|nr:DUF2235 domain-containing protein [Hyalangium sp.]
MSSPLASVRHSNVTRPPPVKNSSTEKPREPCSPEKDQWINFFFDGTGNNLQADDPTEEHSNVARLFQSQRGNSMQRIFSFYIPGLGTYFKDIGDPGGDDWRGNAIGKRGTDRLNWAMKWVDQALQGSGGRKTHIALFGFSRGAALARAFALRIAQRCRRKDNSWWMLHQGRVYPVRLSFMGLFDTVASVGTPMSLNQAPIAALAMADRRAALMHRSLTQLPNLAFGEPGADPAPGPANGHMYWANDLHVPEMVEKCVHMVAAHEVRQSFPLDSVLEGSAYPRNCQEIVYPGVHSNIGGGYRPLEGARSSLLSLIPLWAMRDEAVRAGVPLEIDLLSEKDFGGDPSLKSNLGKLVHQFNHYLDTVEKLQSSKSLGDVVLAHMRLYYQWRFRRIRLNQAARSHKRPTPDQAVLQRAEKTWENERKMLTKLCEELWKQAYEQKLKVDRLKNSRAEPKYIQSEELMAELAMDEYSTAKARLDTLPGAASSLVSMMNIYDDQCMADARIIRATARLKSLLLLGGGPKKLRPHYRALLEAYDAESNGKGLKDPDLIAFFDNYVHDSLAGFAMDATLPSDPRVLYIGKDEKLRYA